MMESDAGWDALRQRLVNSARRVGGLEVLEQEQPRFPLHLVDGGGQVFGEELSGCLTALLGGAKDEAGGGRNDFKAELSDLVLV